MKNAKRNTTIILVSVISLFCSCSKGDAGESVLPAAAKHAISVSPDPDETAKAANKVDTALYNKLQLHLVHGKPTAKWPVKAEYPLPGALLPFNRIVAYYGNFYSKGMGILGELPPEQMLAKLQQEVKVWERADPVIPVKAALHYIAVTAQRNPGAGSKYRLRMPHHQIQKAIDMARSANAIVFLDVQVGHSSLQEELPALEPYLKLPDVHLGIDPEYSMKGGQVPCTTIGTFDGSDINYACSYLASLVSKYNIPPKILVVHRFTKEMVTNYKQISRCREVQIVVNMDGFGFPAKKISSYQVAVVTEPIQFGGFKLFYKNDKLTAPHRLMTPFEILALSPSPVYIQYQ